MVIKMKQITKQTLEEIERKFKTNNGYVLSNENLIYCPQVNGLVNICLNELGFLQEAKNNCQGFLDSSSHDKVSGLFWREVDLKGNIKVPKINTCKNSIFALALSQCEFSDAANEIMDSLKRGPAYNLQEKLFTREYDSKTREVNPLIITQSNLWAALAYVQLGRKQEATQLVESLEEQKFDKSTGLFISQDCRLKNAEQNFYCDDQALAIIVYSNLGEQEKAMKLMQNTIDRLYDARTGLFNSSSIDKNKSTYKNSLMGFALGRLGQYHKLLKLQKGLVSLFYDEKSKLFRQSTTDKTEIPDNSALALVCLNYNHIRHLVF